MKEIYNAAKCNYSILIEAFHWDVTSYITKVFIAMHYVLHYTVCMLDSYIGIGSREQGLKLLHFQKGHISYPDFT